MELVKDEKDFSNLVDNQVFGDIELHNAEIEWDGKGNILYCVGKIKLENCKIRFSGNHSIVYIDENFYPFSINVRIGNDSVFYLGKDVFLNQTSYVFATERKNVLIGNQLLLSFGCYFRTADPHLLYDTRTKKRINYSKSILIGDRVWIGQNSLILKGTKIGSGAVIGGGAVISGKNIPSNTVYAGNPARKIRSNVFFGKFDSTDDYEEEDIKNSDVLDIDDYCYEKDENTVDLEKIDKELQEIKSVSEKLEYIKKNLSNYQYKNRFFRD